MPAISVGELRKALGDDIKAPSFIETERGRGYRFVAPVRTASASVTAMKSQPMPAVLAPPIVGRGPELKQIGSSFAKAKDGTRQVVFVAGEPGIGKTTFVRAFTASIAADNAARIGHGQCVEQYGAGEPYMPVLEALNRLCQEPGGELLLEVLRQLAPTWLLQMPSLLTEGESERLRRAARGVTQERMLGEMTRALEAMAVETPLVLLLEDLHWSDPSTLELISALGRQSGPARLVVIGTYRPAEMLSNGHPLRRVKDELELHNQSIELRLRLLKENDIADYLVERFSPPGVRKSLFTGIAALIHAGTEGNPLFVVGLVDFLIAQGIIDASNGAFASGFRPLLEADRINMPRNIVQMIERNLDQLGAEEQRVLQVASVAGTEFTAAAVAAALGLSTSEIEDCCTRLSRREQFLHIAGVNEWPDGTVTASFRFHHVSYRDVLYDRVPAGHRIELHRWIAMREESAYGERAYERASELAHHYYSAHDKGKAATYFQLAGERATARGASPEAEHHYLRALDLLKELPEGVVRDRHELRLQVGLGTALSGSKSWAHSDTLLAFLRAQQLSEKLGETHQLATVLFGMAAIAITRGQISAAEDLSQQMLRMIDSKGERWLICAAQYILGQARLFRAKLVQAQEHLELASQYFEEDSRELAALGAIVPSAVAASVALQLGFPDRARQLLDEALHTSERRGNLYHVAFTLMFACYIYMSLREWQTLSELAEKLERLTDTNPYFTGHADFLAGEALLMQDRVQEGLARKRRAAGFWDRLGYRLRRPLELISEAQYLAKEGNIIGALGVITQALEETEDVWLYRPQVLMSQGNLLAQLGAAALEVEAAYRQAICCALSQDNKWDEMQSATHFARWLKAHGRHAEARTMLTDIYNWFIEGFDTLALKEAKALLDEFDQSERAEDLVEVE
jgi:predicted ATPase